MSDLGLYIAASGLDASNIAMDAVSQDLANVNTPEYVRTQADNISDPGSSNFAPGGVTVGQVQQITSASIQAAAFTSDGMLSSAQELNQVLNQAQSIFPEPNQAGSIQSELSTFWSNWDSVANNPTSLGTRTSLVIQAQSLAANLNESYNTLNTVSTQTGIGLQQTVTEANTELSQVAALNEQITEAQADDGDANDLISQRNEILDQLAQNIGTTYSNQPDGSVSVYLAGLTLVQGNSQIDTLSVATSNTVTTLAATTAASPTVTVSNPAGISIGSSVTDALGNVPPNTFVTGINGDVVTLSNNVAATVANPPGDALTFSSSLSATVNSSITNAPVTSLGGTAEAQVEALTKVGAYITGLNNVAGTLANTVNAQQANGFYWSGAAAGSAPSATGTTAYAGNLNTSGNPLDIFVNSNTGTTSALNAGNIGIQAQVVSNPFFLAASDANSGAIVQSEGPIGATTTITAGVNDQFQIATSLAQPPAPAPVTATIAAGSYTPAQLAAAVQAAANAALGGGGEPLVTATIAGPGLLILQTVNQASSTTIQLTDVDALGSLGLATMASFNAGGPQQNNGGNAQEMAEQFESLTGPDLQYQNVIGQLGSDVSTAGSVVSAQQAQTASADQVNQSISGVSIDDETAQMLLYQNSYEASGKVVSSVENMFASLLSAVS